METMKLGGRDVRNDDGRPDWFGGNDDHGHHHDHRGPDPDSKTAQREGDRAGRPGHRSANGTHAGNRAGGASGIILGLWLLWAIWRGGPDTGDPLCRDRWRADMIAARMHSERRIAELMGGE